MSKKEREIIDRQQKTIDTMRQAIGRYRFVNGLLEKSFLETDKKRKRLKKRLKAYDEKLRKLRNDYGLELARSRAKDKALTDLTNELTATKEENDTLKCMNKIFFDREEGEDIDAIIGDDGK